MNGALLGQFLEAITLEEQVLLQRQRDLEGQAIREAMGGKQDAGGPQRVWEEDEAFDLATIPHYEAYR